MYVFPRAENGQDETEKGDLCGPKEGKQAFEEHTGKPGTRYCLKREANCESYVLSVDFPSTYFFNKKILDYTRRAGWPEGPIMLNKSHHLILFRVPFWSTCTRILFLIPPKTGSQTVQMKHSKMSFREPGGRNWVKCLTPRL